MTEPVHWQAELRGRRPSAAEYVGLARSIHEAPGALHPVHLVLLSSYTTSLLAPTLVVESARMGLHVRTHHGEFGQFEQALFGSEWHAPDGATPALVLAMRLEDLAPGLPDRPNAVDFGAFAADVLARIEACIALFRQHADGPVLVANFAPPAAAPFGVFDANRAGSLTHRIHALNRTLAERLAGTPETHVWDYAGLVAASGSREWTDPRLWALARTPVASQHQPAFAAHLARTLRGTLSGSAKCLVLDLDNTLWGGVVGDDGLRGLQLGDEHPGRSFKELQRVALGLRDRGVLLAVASKNDPEVAEEALREHPEMLIRPEHLAATRFGWGPKSQSLREIAQELNLGIDSLVFFDDNPVERAEVLHGAPSVQVVDVPADPALFAQTLRDVVFFDSPRVTTEDLGRAEAYRAETERAESLGSAASLGEFLDSLEMKAVVGTLDEATAPRVAQLVGKTNQFNATTRRQNQTELESWHDAQGLPVLWLRLRDRYGDLGLIGVGVLSIEGDSAVVHNLIMSCRAANRGVERTLLSALADAARSAGLSTLVGEYVPSPRNHPIAELYPSLGFHEVATEGDVRRFERDLSSEPIEPSSHIDVESA